MDYINWFWLVRCVKKIRDQTRKIQNSESKIRSLVDLLVKSTKKGNNCWKILKTKPVCAWLYIIHRLQLMQKYRQKTRQMAKMSRKISHSTVCMLAFSAVAFATVPSGRHPIIAFFEAIKPCRMEDMTIHGLRTPNEGINQRYVKIWADVADKICCRHT